MSVKTPNLQIASWEYVDYEPKNYRLLSQGWTDQERLEFWFTAQGSQFMPYRWFLQLERPDSKILFRSSKNVRKYGYIPYPIHKKWNPDGLPIGFAKDVDEKTKTEWVGLTCAACHTGTIQTDSGTIVVDGGQSMSDFQSFFQDLAKAMRKTLENEAKFERFSRNLLKDRYSVDQKNQLRQKFASLTRTRETREKINYSTHRYGIGRVDAFGQIFNAVTVIALGVPDNSKSADAPVSYPVLWGTHQSDVVQWNGLASNTTILDPISENIGPLSRNIGQVLGVFGKLEVTKLFGIPRYRSSIKRKNLERLEELIAKLQTPLWPVRRFGPLDKDAAARGSRIFTGQSGLLPEREVCYKCHSVRVRGSGARFFEHLPGYPRIPPKYVANMISIKEIGTDSTMARNTLRVSKTGLLKDTSQALKFPPRKFGESAENVEILTSAVFGVLIEQLRKSIPIHAKTIRSVREGVYTESQIKRMRYKARPLNGIWASAPYLHNGSVPTIYELLKRPELRTKIFCVGNMIYDTKKLGLSSRKPNTCLRDGGFVFDTRKKGNSNTGHSFGTRLTTEQKMDLIEYLKKL